jgi:hypothetical protein
MNEIILLLIHAEMGEFVERRIVVGYMITPASRKSSLTSGVSGFISICSPGVKRDATSLRFTVYLT